MRKVGAAAFAALGLGVLIGCSTFRDQSKAMVGGGAVAGQDYINGLTPSEKSRTYFAQNASDESKAVTISRTGDGANDTGVRFVANGGIVIPPGASITFENKGYCCDPHLPAPKAGDEFQFVKTTQLIPEELQGIYRKLLTKASNGDEATLKSMQKLVWALRTAGTEAGYANNLTEKEKKILNSCSEYEGEFELYCSEKLALSRFWKKLLAQADAYTTVNIGGVTYQASDLLDDKVGEKKIKAHLGQLITLGESMPVEHTGFNYGELASGIYTDIKGTGPLKFKATVANSTLQNFTFYPMDYIAQVGSGVSDESASVVYFATASTTQKQRVTIEPQDEVEVEEVEEEIKEEDEKCDHVWVAMERDRESQELDNVWLDEMSKRKDLRKRYADQIAAERANCADRIRDFDKESCMEYGTLLYYQNGQIKSLELAKGNRDYQLEENGTQVARTTYRQDPSDGQWKYYAYKGKTGEVDYSVSYPTKYANLNQDAVNVKSVGSLDIGALFNKLPSGAVPVEYVHLHPNNEYIGNDSQVLSYQDVAYAHKQGVNATAVIPPNIYNYWNGAFDGWTQITYDPSTRSYTQSDGRSSEDVQFDHNRAGTTEELYKAYRIYCVRCGAVK